jgi:hypothetical protein
MFDLRIKYETSLYDYLCFKHAVEQANKGAEVETVVFNYTEGYMGSLCCERCSEGLERKQQEAMRNE